MALIINHAFACHAPKARLPVSVERVVGDRDGRDQVLGEADAEADAADRPAIAPDDLPQIGAAEATGDRRRRLTIDRKPIAPTIELRINCDPITAGGRWIQSHRKTRRRKGSGR